MDLPTRTLSDSQIFGQSQVEVAASLAEFYSRLSDIDVTSFSATQTAVVNHRINATPGFTFFVSVDDSVCQFVDTNLGANCVIHIGVTDNTNTKKTLVFSGGGNLGATEFITGRSIVLRGNDSIDLLVTDPLSGRMIVSARSIAPLYASAVPTSGTYYPGEVVRNSAPAVGAPQGWVCTASPRTFAAMANL